jgi:hypothetical protein
VPAPAAASCAPPEDDRTRLRQADAAFVGELVRRSEDDEVLIFRVERGLKGRFEDEVEVRDEYPRSSVSLRPEPNTRVGVLLQREGAEYVANQCQLADPDALIRAAGEDADPPLVALTSRRTHSLASGGRVRMRASVSERSAVAASARLLVDGRELRGSVHVEQSASTGSLPRPVVFTVVIRRHGRDVARSALRRGHSVQLVVRVIARDAAGNRGRARRTVQLTR